MEILEHGKQKTTAKVENIWKIASGFGKAGFPTKSNSSTSCSDSKLGPLARLRGTSKDVTRLRPATRVANRKSDEWGERKSLPLTPAPWNFK
ncbi:hypothetical protein AVEN_160593-1 [Araneus ventricosus]|uniref:Uncharacterized protein n=1 Tax=Araneus ventricosus TaxID=182803 RepID=A0A4Y2JU15_ARAVE|nr:hypothetical protein AVEN_109474-1 [Araneus ventricosus]GBM93558.1 hypothetical protein AVEN_160593-1 [Araneus ventricosus]